MSAPEGWLPVEVTLTLHVNPTVDADGRHEVIVPEDGGSLRAWLSPEAFEARFGVPMPRPPEPTPAEFIRSLIHAGRNGVHVVIDPPTEDRLNKVLGALTALDSTPAEADDWISDAESVIHQHCGSDGSDDAHNDWVNDLANDLWRTLGAPATPSQADMDLFAAANGPKSMRETLCVAQSAIGRQYVDRMGEHVDRLQRLCDVIDQHRPLGPDGKHGTGRCTPTCDATEAVAEWDAEDHR